MKSPLVIAHRGNSSSAPENTLAAIRESIELGADGVEVDVRCTKDGVPVLMHDPSIGRTANGALRPPMGNVSALTLDELRKLDVGGWKSERYRGERIPTLEDALLEAAERTALVAEIKVDCSEQIEQVVRRLKIRDGLFFAGFRLDVLQKLYRTMPEFEVVWLLDGRDWVGQKAARTLELATESEVTILAPSLATLARPTTSCAHEMGLRVWTYECNDVESFRKAIDAGVDGIITNSTSELMQLIRAGAVALPAQTR